MIRNKASFYGEKLSTHPSKLEDHSLSAVPACLFNIFTATRHVGSRSSIPTPWTFHVLVTGTHLWGHGYYTTHK